MDTLNWKLDKIKSLDDEVKELHPVLRALFNAMPKISKVLYTQGSRENGADFVLVKNDDLLDQDEYIGVVVKSSSIRQGSDDVHRQIKECTLAPRPIEGGKKSIYLTEVWVVTSKDITRNAQDFFHFEYKTTKIKFIDSATIVSLINKYLPNYWEISNIDVNRYVAEQKSSLEMLGNMHRMLPKEFGRITVEQEIQRIAADSKRKFGGNKSRPTKLWNEVQKNKLIFIEGGMGSGKSDLLRATALKMCESNVVNETHHVPFFVNYRELIKEPDYCSANFLDKIHARVGDISKKVVIFIDGFDESQELIEKKVDSLCSFAGVIHARSDTALVVASRNIDDENLSVQLSKIFDKYNVCPLSYGNIVNFVQKICDKSSVSSKLKEDLQRSPLMRALPRTPLSAILLGKLLKENINELPSTLPELYSKYVELVLGRWDLEKGSGTEKEYETIQRLTAMVAVYFLDNDLDRIGIDELAGMFRNYLNERRTGQALGPMLESFLSKTELISCNNEDRIVRFRHKSFIEYFYAHSLLMEKGKNAPIFKPFDVNWHGIEYFYLGLVRDVPNRIDQLSAYMPSSPAEEFIKFSQFGSFLMAGYQTPYENIKSAVYKSFRDGAAHYVRVVRGDDESALNRLPELQLLSLFTQFIRHGYAYDFFRPALHDARLQAELDDGLDIDEQIALIFLVDTVLCELRDESAFQTLVDRHETHLSWTIRLGIYNASADVEFINSAAKYVSKKMQKSAKNNRGLHPYIQALETVPLADRKDLKRLPK